VVFDLGCDNLGGSSWFTFMSFAKMAKAHIPEQPYMGFKHCTTGSSPPLFASNGEAITGVL